MNVRDKIVSEKTMEQLRQEMIEKMQQQGGATFMQEVAMPGVVQQVNPDNIPR